MKKKILLSVFTLAVVAVTTFTSYKTFGAKATVAELMLDENIEALTQGESNELDRTRFYQRSASRCPFPCEYRTSVTCKSGGREVCSAADCC